MEYTLWEVMVIKCNKLEEKTEEYLDIAYSFSVSPDLKQAKDEYINALLNWEYYAIYARESAEYMMDGETTKGMDTYNNKALDYLKEGANHFGVAAFIINQFKEWI